jgi:hypothetical protein
MSSPLERLAASGKTLVECSYAKNSRHPREGGDPFSSFKTQWIPAFAGMTISFAFRGFC